MAETDKFFSSSKLLKDGFRGSIYHYFTAAIAALLNFLIVIYILQRLNLEEFGIYNFLLAAVLFIRTVTSLGTDSVVQRYLPEYEEKGNNYFKKRILSGSMLICFFAAVVLLGILFIARTRIIDFFHLPEYSKNLFCISMAIALLALESHLLGNIALVALLKNRYWSFCRITYSLIKLILFYFAFRLNYGLTGILWGWLISEFLLLIFFLIKGYQDVFSLPVRKENIQKLPVRRFINFAKFLYFHKLTQFFKRKGFDIFLLSYFLDTKAVAIYSFCFGIPLLLMQLSPANKLHPILKTLSVRNYTRQKNYENFSYLFAFINRLTFFIMIPLFIFVMILADKITLFLLNPDYIKTVYLFRLSLAFIAIHQFGFVYTPILFTLEKTKIIFITGLISFYNLVMDILLIPIYGVLGAILATGSTGIIVILYYRYATGKIIRLSYPWKSFAVFTLNTLFAAGLLFILRPFMDDVFSLIFVFALTVTAYLIFSFLNKGFEQKDRDIINAVIGRKIWVF